MLVFSCAVMTACEGLDVRHAAKWIIYPPPCLFLPPSLAFFLTIICTSKAPSFLSIAITITITITPLNSGSYPAWVDKSNSRLFASLWEVLGIFLYLDFLAQRHLESLLSLSPRHGPISPQFPLFFPMCLIKIHTVYAFQSVILFLTIRPIHSPRHIRVIW